MFDLGALRNRAIGRDCTQGSVGDGFVTKDRALKVFAHSAPNSGTCGSCNLPLIDKLIDSNGKARNGERRAYFERGFSFSDSIFEFLKSLVCTEHSFSFCGSLQIHNNKAGGRVKPVSGCVLT
jgi:hypothetical protein